MSAPSLPPFPALTAPRELPREWVLAKMHPKQRAEVRRAHWSPYAQARRWASICGYRIIEDALATTGQRPSLEALADALHDAINEHAEGFVSQYDWHMGGGGRRSLFVFWEDSERMASEAATFALDQYDPAVHERAVNGGRISKRPPTDGLRLIPVWGLSRPEQARRLKVSEATVARMRRRLIARGIFTREQAIDALLDH